MEIVSIKIKKNSSFRSLKSEKRGSTISRTSFFGQKAAAPG
jgi:hypothetical protein